MATVATVCCSWMKVSDRKKRGRHKFVRKVKDIAMDTKAVRRNGNRTMLRKSAEIRELGPNLWSIRGQKNFFFFFFFFKICNNTNNFTTWRWSKKQHGRENMLFCLCTTNDIRSQYCPFTSNRQHSPLSAISATGKQLKQKQHKRQVLINNETTSSQVLLFS